MEDFLTKRQILFLEYAKEKGRIKAIDIKKFYTTHPTAQLKRLIGLGYLEEDTSLGYLKYTGKEFRDVSKFDNNEMIEVSEPRRKIIFVKEKLQELSKINKMVLFEDLKKEVLEELSEEEFNETIDKLKELGDIFECKEGYLQLI